MHDDQHGTAIISSAALKCTRISREKIENAKIIVSAGSAALACANLYVQLGVSAANIIMFDKDGVLSNDRTDLSLIQNGTQLKQKA
jgi:malate dehydrogenase (oxaloacetate-decarboxylating)(NADP+)